MEYKLIGNNDYLKNPIKTILVNRGITNPSGFIDVGKSSELNYSLLNNIDKAAELIIHHLENKNNIFIQVDCDADGYTSSAILIGYIKKAYPRAKITYRLQEGKQHGINPDDVPSNTDLVIIPDAGSNQYDEHKVLRDRGLETLVIDHHDCDIESEDALIVNNQLSPEYKNKSLTGAGMVYKVCQALDAKLNKDIAKQFVDLVSIGNIADSADSRELETRYYMYLGLNELKNPLLRKLFKKQEYSTGGNKTIQSTQFYISPLINAAIRVGSREEKEQMFKALLGSREKVSYKKRGSDTEEMVSIQDDTVRMLTNLKGKQKRLVDKATEEIEIRIESKGLLDNKVLIVYVEGILDKDLTGLVANKLADSYKRPVLLTRKDEEEGMLSGSIRGYDKGEIKDFKELLLSTGQFEFVEGHPNAAGFKIKRERLAVVNDELNERLKEIAHSDCFEVDFEIPSNELTKDFIFTIDNHKFLWGCKVEEPLISITNIEIAAEGIEHIGKKNKNTIKFKCNDIEYIRFKSGTEYYENLASNKSKSLVLNIIGKAKANEYMGRKTAQFEIVELEVVKTKEKELVF
ncbi:DHH family phosphoesterase [Bacillus altitudinis]